MKLNLKKIEEFFRPNWKKVSLAALILLILSIVFPIIPVFLNKEFNLISLYEYLKFFIFVDKTILSLLILEFISCYVISTFMLYKKQWFKPTWKKVIITLSVFLILSLFLPLIPSEVICEHDSCKPVEGTSLIRIVNLYRVFPQYTLEIRPLHLLSELIISYSIICIILHKKE